MKQGPNPKEPHPLTELIPVKTDLEKLSMDIAMSVQREPVVLYEGKIVEGRVRYQACLEIGREPQFKDWVLVADGDVLDWMVRRHVADHDLSEIELIQLAAAVLPHYRAMKGQTDRLLYKAIGGLSWNKIRTINWLEEADALGPVLSGEKDVFEAARRLGLVPDKRGVALGKSYGHGDKFDEVMVPLKRYLSAWKRRGYQFRHLNPKEASRRVLLIDSAVEELLAAKKDLEKRSVSLTYTTPTERRK